MNKRNSFLIPMALEFCFWVPPVAQSDEEAFNTGAASRRSPGQRSNSLMI